MTKPVHPKNSVKTETGQAIKLAKNRAQLKLPLHELEVCEALHDSLQVHRDSFSGNQKRVRITITYL